MINSHISHLLIFVQRNFSLASGPLVCKVDGKFTHVGVVSWGAGCALPDLPGVYAKTTSQLSWIKNIIKSGDDQC